MECLEWSWYDDVDGMMEVRGSGDTKRWSGLLEETVCNGGNSQYQDSSLKKSKKRNY